MNKSPIKKPPLRYPGQSLDEKIQDIGYGTIYPKAINAVVFIFLAISEWYRQINHTKPVPYAISAIALIVVVYLLLTISKDIKEMKNAKLGRNGERAVGQYLESFRKDGYQVFHDIIGEGFNIDHVIIGPAGVFTVETKTISKPVNGEAKIEYNGQEVFINGYRPDRNPIVQAKAEANWLKQLLCEFTSKDCNVRPVVLYPGWYIESKSQKGNVWVLEPKALPKFLANETTILQSDEISLLSAHLSMHIRATAEALLKKF